MRKTVAHLAIAAFLLVGVPLASSAQPLETLKAGVVKLRVETSDGEQDTGAGNVIGVQGNTVFILTAYHVVEDAASIKVSFDNARWEELADSRVYRFDAQMDIAAVLVKHPAPPTDLPKFQTRSAPPRDGERVLAIGHPPGLEWEVARETVVRTSDPGDTRMFRVSVSEIDRGNSGGPLFDMEGALLGTVLRVGAKHATVVRIGDSLAKLNEWRTPKSNLTDQAAAGAPAGKPGAQGTDTTRPPARKPPEPVVDEPASPPAGGTSTLVELGGAVAGQVAAGESRAYRIATATETDYVLRVVPESRFNLEIEVTPGPGGAIDKAARGVEERHAFSGTGEEVLLTVRGVGGAAGGFEVELTKAPPPAIKLGTPRIGEVGLGQAREYRIPGGTVGEYTVTVEPQGSFDVALRLEPGPAEPIDQAGAGGSESFVFMSSGEEVVVAVEGNGGAAGSYSLAVGVVTEKIEPRSGIRFVPIPAGTFTMSADLRDPWVGCDDSVVPHEVTISRPFWMAATETSNAHYRKCVEAGFCSKPTSDVNDRSMYEYMGEDLPVREVTWEQARRFAEWIGGRLPTEAEWEYAARAGTTGTRYWSGETDEEMQEYDWVGNTSSGHPKAVGTKGANPWGLHDVHGNVTEWVADWHGPLSGEAQVDPTGPESGTRRVTRSGWSLSYDGSAISACRRSAEPDDRSQQGGFRVALPGAAPLSLTPAAGVEGAYKPTCPVSMEGCDPGNECVECHPSCGGFCQNLGGSTCGPEDCMSCPPGKTLEVIYGDGTGRCV